MYTLQYNIPQHSPTKQRKSIQTINNLDKSTLASWILWLTTRKHNVSYKVI